MRDRIKRLQVITEGGKVLCFTGHGDLHRVATCTAVDGKPPAQWPALTYVDAHLVIEEEP